MRVDSALILCVSIEITLCLVLVVKVDFISASASKLLRFSVGIGMNLVVRVVEVYLNVVFGFHTSMTFCVVWASQTDSSLAFGIETALIRTRHYFVRGFDIDFLKIICLQCGNALTFFLRGW